MRVLLGLLALAVIAVLVFVGTSSFGRGTRPAAGEPRETEHGDLGIVWYEGAARAGPGESVVLLASLGRPASDFNELVEVLNGAGYRSLAVESRGIGGSEGGGPWAEPTLHDLAADVAAVLDDAGLGPERPVHIVGHAFGNRVARSFAADYPARTRSVGCIAAGGRVPVPERIGRALFTSLLSFLPWSLREGELRLAFFGRGNPVPDYWRSGWSLWGALAQLDAVAAGRAEDFWDAGGAPLLVVQGDSDTIAPPEHAGIPLREEFPDQVTLVEVAGAGHALLPERPEPIARGLLDFLAAHPIVPPAPAASPPAAPAPPGPAAEPR